MKKLFAAGWMMLISLAGLKAQITITQADMPVVNDTIRISVATPLANSLNFNQTGANTNWDFSTLQAGSQEVVRYVSSLSTPYGFYFLNTYGNKIADSLGGFGAFSFKNVYNFYRRTAQKFTAEGLGVSVNGIPLAADYSDPDEQYTFPLAYNDFDSTTFAVSLNIPTLGTFKSKGYRINRVDGWGNITTPYGTYPCIRVTSSIISNDSLTISQPVPFSFGFPNNRQEIRWLTNGQKLPLLEVQGTQQGANFVANRVTYRDIARLWPVNVSEADWQNKLWHEAGTHRVHFTLEQNQPATLLDMQGREVAAYTLEKGNSSITLDSRFKGVYLLRINQAGSGYQVLKLMLP